MEIGKYSFFLIWHVKNLEDRRIQLLGTNFLKHKWVEKQYKKTFLEEREGCPGKIILFNY